MRLSAKRKVYVVVTGLAFAALLVDRLVLDGGQTAPSVSAAAYVVPQVRKAPSAGPFAQGSAPKEQRQGHVAVCERLAAFGANQGDADTVRNAFVASPEWAAELRGTSAAASPSPSAAESFRKQHHLTAVMVDRTGGQAVVDGKCLRIGQQIDGFSLVSVEKRAVTFASGDITVELKLSDGAVVDGKD